MGSPCGFSYDEVNASGKAGTRPAPPMTALADLTLVIRRRHISSTLDVSVAGNNSIGGSRPAAGADQYCSW
jgi:hypothetical protein